jgi:hypothetical protein
MGAKIAGDVGNVQECNCVMRAIVPPFDLREIAKAQGSVFALSLAALRTSIRRRWSLRRELQLVLAHQALQIAIRLLRASLRSGRNPELDFAPLTSVDPPNPWTTEEIAILAHRGQPVVPFPAINSFDISQNGM